MFHNTAIITKERFGGQYVNLPGLKAILSNIPVGLVIIILYDPAV